MADSEGGVVRIEVPDIESMIDREDAGDYPHRGVNLADGVGMYLELLAREHPRKTSLTVEVAIGGDRPKPGVEEEVRDAIHGYFAAERLRAGLDLEVNQKEGWAVFGWAIAFSFAFAVGVVVLALLAPEIVDYKVLSYLLAGVVIIFVWVLIWDPFEKITYSAQLLRYRNRALDKLRVSTVRFAYGGAGSTTRHWDNPGA